MGRPPVSKKRVYLGVFGDKITEKSEKGAENSITRVLKKGDVKVGEKHEFQYDYWDGIITNIRYNEGNGKDGKIIKSWNVTIKSGDEEFTLSVPYASRYTTSFYKKARNIVFADLVRIVPFQFQNDDGKDVRGFSFYQLESLESIEDMGWNFHSKDGEGIKVENYWTQENTLPPVETKAPNGKKAWDYSAQNNQLQQDFIDVVAQVFGNTPDPAPEAEPQQADASYSRPAQSNSAEQPMQQNQNADADMRNEGDPPPPPPPIGMTDGEGVVDDLPF